MLNPTLPLHKHTLPSKLKHKMLNPILPLHKHTLLSKLKHIHHTRRHSKHSLNTDVQNGKHYSMNGKHCRNALAVESGLCMFSVSPVGCEISTYIVVCTVYPKRKHTIFCHQIIFYLCPKSKHRLLYVRANMNDENEG